jgi:tetratricopeptide (TPR) repeat protein
LAEVYEIATIAGGAFQKCDNVTYLLQEFDGRDVTPRLVLRPQYVGQNLYLRSYRFDGNDYVSVILPPHLDKNPAGEVVPTLRDFDAECICTLTLLKAEGTGTTCSQADWTGGTHIRRKGGAIVVDHSPRALDHIHREWEGWRAARSGASHPLSLDEANRLANRILVMEQADSRADTWRQWELVYQVRNRELGKRDIETLKALNNLALAQGRQGDLMGARARLEEVVDSLNLEEASARELLLPARGNLAVIQYTLGDFAGALRSHEVILEVKIKYFGPEHTSTLKTKGILVALLFERGNIDDAQRDGEALLAIRRRVLGNDHFDTAQSMQQLAEILHSKKHFDAAARVQQEAIATLRRAIGADASATREAQRVLERFLGTPRRPSPKPQR